MPAIDVLVNIPLEAGTVINLAFRGISLWLPLLIGFICFRFVLALILMRKRRLKYEGTKMQGDQEIWQLKVTGEKRVVDVLNPQLGEEQIEQLSGQIGEVLNADL